MLVIMNHKLTSEQVEAVKNEFGEEEKIIYLPKTLQQIWGQIDPQNDENMYKSLVKIRDWADRKKDEDTVLIQGESGATFWMVASLERSGFYCYYATTRRESVEEVQEDGSVVKRNVFKHIKFRRYRWPI